MEWREESGVRWLDASLPGARAVFSTRLGGASESPFESLNLGILTDDDPARTDTAIRRLYGLAAAGVASISLLIWLAARMF